MAGELGLAVFGEDGAQLVAAQQLEGVDAALAAAGAVEAQGLAEPEIRSGVTPLGLWRIAQAAGLAVPTPVRRSA